MKEGIIYIYCNPIYFFINYHYNGKEYERLSNIEYPINRLRKIHTYVNGHKVIYY